MLNGSGWFLTCSTNPWVVSKLFLGGSGWFLHGFVMVSERFLIGCWVVLDGVWVVLNGSGNFWMVPGWLCVVPGWFLNGFWLVLGGF